MVKRRDAICLLGGLFLLFLGLKLGGVLAWSWAWVTAPLWGLPVLVGAFVLVVLLLAGFVVANAAAIEFLLVRRNRKLVTP